MTANQIRRQVAERLHKAGCSDGGCVFGHLGGMATNGGCMCLKERELSLLRRTILQLADVNRTLAALVSTERLADVPRQQDGAE